MDGNKMEQYLTKWPLVKLKEGAFFLSSKVTNNFYAKKVIKNYIMVLPSLGFEELDC